jgi:hypothetical protein
MRVMISYTMTAELEAGTPPEAQMTRDLFRLAEEMGRAGVLLAGEGVQPSSQGARVSVDGDERTVSTGPFGRPEELLGGFLLAEVRSLDEGVEWAARLARVLDAQVDVRPLYELSDFGADALPAGDRERVQSVLDTLRGS